MIRCLETRQRQGMKWRRYRTDDGVVFTTFEVPTEVITTLGAKRLKEELDRALRNRARATRNAKGIALLKQGWKPLAIAQELGICEAQARRLRKQVKP